MLFLASFSSPAHQSVTGQISEAGAAAFSSTLAAGHASLRLLVLAENRLGPKSSVTFAAARAQVGMALDSDWLWSSLAWSFLVLTPGHLS